MPPNSPAQPSQNAILAALRHDTCKRLMRNARILWLPPGFVLHEPFQPIHQVYFPLTCVASLLSTTQSGASSELAAIGREGMVGVAVCLGGGSMPSGAVVRHAGHALNLSAAALQDEFNRGEELQLLLLRYVQASLVLISQIAVCNRHHSLEQRLCRWLLLDHYLHALERLSTTHESIAKLIGGRREGVTVAMARLHAAGLIQAARGRIVISDWSGLEARACECYQVVRGECERLLAKFEVDGLRYPSASGSPRGPDA